jgi:hypothetical protein
MNWDTEPATEKQLNYLKMFGYVPDRPLTKTEAHDLLSKFEEDPERCQIRTETRLRESAIYEKERRENLAYFLRTDCEFAAKAYEELKLCKKSRLNFWKDTFDLGERLSEAFQAYDFHNKYGCQFKKPSNEQIKGVLDALDSRLPTWDKDSPILFYQTLELNFPELLRK